MKDPKKTVTFLITLIVCAGTIYMLCNARAFGVTGESLNDKIEKSLYTSILYTQNEAMQWGYKLNGHPFWPNAVIRRPNGDSISSKKAFGKGAHTMVFQFSERNCSVCIDSALVHFKNFANDVGMENTCLISFTDDIRVYSEFIKINKLQFGHMYACPLYFKDTTYNSLPNFPIYYMLDSSLRMSEVFFPIKEFSARTEAYLRTMRYKYFD